MGTAARRILSFIVVAAGWVIAAIRAALDFIGWSTAPDDVGVAMSRADQFLFWLISLPWYVPWGFVMVSTSLLIYSSWPRPSLVATLEPPKQSGQPTDQVAAIGAERSTLAAEISLELMDRQRSAPNAFFASGANDAAQREFLDKSSAYDKQTIHILGHRFSGRVSHTFHRLRKIGVHVPPVEQDWRLPHWMEDISRFLSAVGPAVQSGDIERANELVASFKKWLRD